MVLFSRIMFLSPFLFGLSSLFGSFAQIKQKFFSFAIAPLLYNLGILIGILALYPHYGMLGIVFGVVIGAFFHMIIQLPSFLSVHSFPKLTRAIDFSLVGSVIKYSLPRTLALSTSNIVFIAMGALGSLLVAGSISVFQLSYNIQTTPLMIIGISYAVAAFPTLTKLFEEQKKQEFTTLIYRAMRNILFLSIPIAVLFIVLRAQIVRVLLGAGVFSWNDTRLVAGSLALFALSVAAQSIILLLVRAFYAQKNTRTPLVVNIIGLFITIGVTIILLALFKYVPLFENTVSYLLRVPDVHGAIVLMLPLGFSIGQICNAFLLWKQFKKTQYAGSQEKTSIAIVCAQIVFASLLGGIVAYTSLSLFGKSVDQARFLGVLLQGLISGVFGLLSYGVVLALLKNEDIFLFVETVKTKFWKTKPIVPEQQDL